MLVCSLLSYCVFTALFSETLTANITVENNCPWKLWPGVRTALGTPVNNTGFELAEGESLQLEVTPPWTAGWIWARTQCEGSTCFTGDCGSGSGACDGRGGAPPTTLAEFNIGGFDGLDFYDVNLLQGFNVPLSITPEGGSGDRCLPTGCTKNLNAFCPPRQAVRSLDRVIGCRSACLALKQPHHCCSDDFNTPQTCQSTKYSRLMKNKCPHAYSYAFDDPTSVFVCSGGPNYLVTFCP